MPHLSSCLKCSLCRSNAHLHHIGIFAAGISGSGCLCSAIELRQLSLSVGFEPTTDCDRSNPCLRHAANFSSIPGHISTANRHTSSVMAARRECSPSHKHKQIREELAFTGLADSNRRPFGPARRSNRKLHHPGAHGPGYSTLSKRLNGISLDSRERA
jgi:hypothetical protein